MRYGVVNGVAYNRRFDRGCLRAREILRAGGIGEVRYVQTVQLGYERAGWFLVPELGGGGPYTGRASHMADLLPWLLGRTPTRLRSRVRTSSPARSDHGGFIELQFDALECQMTCIEEGLHMWDEVRIFGDDGLIELRRPLTDADRLGDDLDFRPWTTHRRASRRLASGRCDAQLRRGGARARARGVHVRAKQCQASGSSSSRSSRQVAGVRGWIFLGRMIESRF